MLNQTSQDQLRRSNTANTAVTEASEEAQSGGNSVIWNTVLRTEC